MGRRWHSGAETGDSTPNDTEFGGSQDLTNFSFDTTVKRSGTRSMKFASGSAGYIETTTGHNMTVAILRGYVRIAGSPGSTQTIMEFLTSGDATIAAVYLKTDRKMELRQGSATVIGTSTTALSTGTFEQYIELYCNKVTNQVALRLNGVLEVIGNAPGMSGVGNIDRGLFGNWTGNLGTDLWFDDCAMNDTAGQTQCSWPGASKGIYTVYPNATHFNLNWVAQNGGSLHAEVDDLPGAVDDASTYIKETAGANAQVGFYTTDPSLAGAIAVTLIGIRGGGTAATDRKTRIDYMDANNRSVSSGDQNWNLNGWKTIYPALELVETWDGVPRPLTTEYMFGQSYLPYSGGSAIAVPARYSSIRIIRTDANATEIRITALWMTVDMQATYGTNTRIDSPSPRVLVELDQP